jgi:UDP-N-acetyl-D-mannosaminuronic acid dehydrogenase
MGTDLDGARVALLGVAYRPGVDETRAAPARRIDELLQQRGADTVAVDPVVSDLSGLSATELSLEDLADREVDAAVLVTAHDAFEGLAWDEVADLVVDTRAVIDDQAVHARVYTLGRG